MRLIHITDPHLTSLAHVKLGELRGKQWLGYQSWLRNRRHRHQRPTLETLLKFALMRSPDLLCITGDLVHVAHPDELAQATDWLAQTAASVRLVIVPGNHDLYHAQAWETVRKDWAPWLGSGLGSGIVLTAGNTDPHPLWPMTIVAGDVVVDCVNSSLPMPWYSAQGELGQDQVSRLAALQVADGQPRVLLIHHPPLSPAEDPSITRRKALRDSQRLRPLLARYDIVLHGHTHHNTVLEAASTRIYATASASTRHASFRQFDFDRVDDHWEIAMGLYHLDGDSVHEIASSRWRRSIASAGGSLPPAA